MLSQYFSSKENPIEISKVAIDMLGLKISSTGLENNLLNHPDYPSLLSISEVFTSFGIDNLAIRSDVHQLQKLPTPFIAQIRNETGTEHLFTVVRQISDSSITYFHPEKHSWKTISKESFEKKWSSRFAFLMAPEKAIEEKEFHKHVREEKRKAAGKYVTIFFLPVIALSLIASLLYKNPATSLIPSFYIFLMTTGYLISIALLWQDIDQHNPLAKQFCSSGKRINCAAVLQSKGAKVMGISWSIIGFVYFSATLIFVLFSRDHNPLNSPPLNWLTLLTSPYIFYSLIYQWKIAKQWCIWCLMVQAILLLQAVLVITSTSKTALISASVLESAPLLSLLLSILIPSAMVIFLMPAYKAFKEAKQSKTQLVRLKNNPEIFEAILEKQKKINTPSPAMGLTIGNLKGRYKIIKVCNPYCGPCSRAHLPLEELLQTNQQLQVQLIFTTSNRPGDISAFPAKHLLAISEQKDQGLLTQALDDWYIPNSKDYEVFSTKYPIAGGLEKYDKRIETMNSWCKSIEIQHTPTFFISAMSKDGRSTHMYEIPQIYQISDLRHMLASLPADAE